MTLSKRPSGLEFPLGTKFVEFRGDMYVAHLEHGLKRIIIGKAGDCYVEQICNQVPDRIQEAKWYWRDYNMFGWLVAFASVALFLFLIILVHLS